MHSDRFSQMNPIKGFTDRKQRTVFLGAVLGLLVNNVLMLIYIIGGDAKTITWITNVSYNLVLVAMAVCAFKNFHFMRVAMFGILLIYFQIWGNTFIYTQTGTESVINLPVLFFSPIAMVLIADYRIMSFLAVTNSTLLYLHAKVIGPQTYAAGWPAADLSAYAAALALLSFISGAMLAVVTFSRERTDKRVLALLSKTDRLAAEDPLTGLQNRRSFLGSLTETLSKRAPFACVFIDLDRFKPLNDEYGHAIGDLVLKTVGERLQAQEHVLKAARFGGDEFAVLLDTEALSEPLETVLTRFHTALTRDISTEAGNVGVGASIGYACSPAVTTDASKLMHAADVAMRKAKSENLNLTGFMDSADEQIYVKTSLDTSFHAALQEGKIQPALQPIVNAATRETCGYEILARWVDSGFDRDPAPADFIPVAERSGRLNHLMLSTLKQVLQRNVLSKGQFISINVSPSQLSNADFLRDLVRLLNRFDLSPSCVELEITEQVAFRNLEHNKATLLAAREAGFRIALDDFGVGYSSLSMLDSLPLNKIKIDRALVQRVQEQSANRDILEAAIGLSKKLGFQCCVEGIENSACANYIAGLGVDQLQGYWFGRPVLLRDISTEAHVANRLIA